MISGWLTRGARGSPAGADTTQVAIALQMVLQLENVEYQKS
jgi:hypothetical protein